MFRVSLHPDGLAARTVNFDEWARYLLGQLHRSARLTGDATLEALVTEVTGYPNVAALGDWRTQPSGAEPALLVPLLLQSPAGDLSLFTTLTVFGTPQDVTLSELAVELFYPGDDATEVRLRGASLYLTGNRLSSPGAAC